MILKFSLHVFILILSEAIQEVSSLCLIFEVELRGVIRIEEHLRV